MTHRSRRVLATGAVLAAATSAVVTGAPPAQAATTTYCSTSTTVILRPTGGGYLFPHLSAPAAGCDFVDNGAPYHFTIGRATSTVITGGGQSSTYTVDNLKTQCTAAGTDGSYVRASGCYVPS
ncbi:hypothetical protein GCM10018785_63050 [Streptomyces longispororuber]|uniref:Secreted protein n=1 Tax=Streptomyces longispororuber TaxID=68230 RepID=A0A919DWW0_9ACTN|nr:hypothetical protein [Streptomyces longispororuber]GHE86778.1 hypothetical protein GCM10018785_63050 [Streptomyces longispororuber]